MYGFAWVVYFSKTCAREATALGFVCFVVLNASVLSANRVDLGFLCFIIFAHLRYFFVFLTPPPLRTQGKENGQANNEESQAESEAVFTGVSKEGLLAFCTFAGSKIHII